MRVFVAGATGATGKFVVQQLLQQGDSVVAVARSKEKLSGLLPSSQRNSPNLTVHEAALLDLTDEELANRTKGCSAVVSCLGHSLTLEGMWGKQPTLVTDATRRLTSAMPSDAKFVLMGSEGVSLPTEPKRGPGQRAAIWLVRNLLPPHRDNEGAAAYLMEHREINWVAVRPTNLVDEEEATGEYSILDSPSGPLFGSDIVSRANVAHFMVRLIKDDTTWEQYKHKMPVLKPKNDSDGGNEEL